MLSGGGKVIIEKTRMIENAEIIFSDLFIQPCSYLIGGEIISPVFSGTAILIPLFGVCGMAWMLVRKRYLITASLALIILSSLMLGIISGENTGLRRITPLVVCIFIFAGAGVELILMISRKTLKKYHFLIYFFLTGLICGSVFTYQKNVSHISNNHRTWLQRNFTYIEGKNYTESVDALVRRMEIRKIELKTDDYSWDVLIMLDMLCRSNGKPYNKPEITGSWPKNIPKSPYSSSL